MAYTYTKQQLEDFTKNCIVATSFGLYKLTKLKEFKKSENNYGENFRNCCTAEFTTCDETGKPKGNSKYIYVEIPGYTLSLGSIFSIYDSCGLVDSYVEDEEKAKSIVFSIKTSSLNGYLPELEYFEEFFINYAKQSQNDYNSISDDSERFDLEFRILNNSRRKLLLK